MKPRKRNLEAPRLLFVTAALFAIFGGLICSTQSSSAKTDGRPRRTAATAKAPPTPVIVKPAPQPTANRVATPTPTPATVDRIAPQLGEPPPPPRLKPKP